ncbi:gpi inositol deacylase pgap1 [Danaus plexippus plexippus]|uniref:GPI inositol-deacylase n=1 Tax=Danaus plexippus plexippus TaxID=278856 RepID=A0A212FP83_DANPL|nr:gpi inositol deacylase pgap1 [Danaus plexippus plexippus]
MTFMFEYPQFVRISLEENKKYPQYGLYAYSEGRFTEKARKMWFDGIPVLFLPGNSGSHMQARSLASVALRKALSESYEYHFDYFTISYNEELSGLYGGVLQGQTEFASACINKILTLYKSNKYTKSVPTSVILIGHSMGGIIAKRLLTYPYTKNSTNIAITLVAPLKAPVINFDILLNEYYMQMDMEWMEYKLSNLRHDKILISIGSGPRDMLIPAGLTASNYSHINTLSTAIPGVWVSPDHVSMVWCKQLVLVINRFLFDIVDTWTEQISINSAYIDQKARQYFKANRSTTLDKSILRHNVSMQVDGFWYEDSRRIYQISRPGIERTTHLMIRLVSFPQNRFVAIESTNVDDKDWIFGCTAKDVHNNYRYCKEATSLSELSRWSGAATDYGRRKLATIHLHQIMEEEPQWTHVIVKVSPTRKPIVLNVDTNDYASRQIEVSAPSDYSFGKRVVIPETVPNSLYYELILSEFNLIHQAYLLYVEPTETCKGQYHVSAEVHVPWAQNNEYYHYFTPLKRSPMKLRLFESNPNITLGQDATEKVKITLLLDPQCTFSVSISISWYHRLAQLSRNYTPILVPYVAAILLLAARNNILNIQSTGCPSIHSALMSDSVRPYFVLVFARLAITSFMSVPFLSFLFENASWRNLELQYFVRSLLVLPTYMTALGIINIVALALLIIMVFSSQLAHRLLFRIVWRGGMGLAEKMAVGLQKVPMLVSAALICAVPLSCGAASLAAGATFYMFILSKMYEEYLEDYVYKLMAKLASRMCYMFKGKKPKEDSKQCTQKEDNSKDITNSENLKAIEFKEHSKKDEDQPDKQTNDTKSNNIQKCDSSENLIDEELSSINFHVMMFFLWMAVTVVNIPALLTWARNFKYSMVLKPDTSYYTGLVMAACSSIIWQMDSPRKNLRNYEMVSSALFIMAVLICALGPFSLSIVNYGVTFMFAIITLQQLYDVDDNIDENLLTQEPLQDKEITNIDQENEADKKDTQEENCSKKEDLNKDAGESLKTDNSSEAECGDKSSDCDKCDESRIYRVFKNLREKFSFGDNE